MRLFRFVANGKIRQGVEEKEVYYDVSSFGEDFNEQFFENDGLTRLQSWFKSNISKCPTLSGTIQFSSCIARPSKIICVGLNYAQHARETNAPIPTEPILFFKSTTALAGPNDDVVIPKNSTKTDWEVELAVVIGKKAKYVSEHDADKYVAGYALHNDYSEREFQLERNGQWVKGKSADTFAPIGPFLVPGKEIPDPQNLRLWLSLNGKILQDSNTSDMVFNVAQLVSYISQFMTLLPGDVISTGTPAGVGLGFKPPIYLKEGDVVELGIDGLGVQRQKAVNYR
jgi:2,4-didehydro-3-deoxy-L-rhamnonate hydrolase